MYLLLLLLLLVLLLLLLFLLLPHNAQFHRLIYVIFQEADSDHTGEAVHTTQQTLTFYELDLGLNHVVRKYSEPLEEHGNLLISG